VVLFANEVWPQSIQQVFGNVSQHGWCDNRLQNQPADWRLNTTHLPNTSETTFGDFQHVVHDYCCVNVAHIILALSCQSQWGVIHVVINTVNEERRTTVLMFWYHWAAAGLTSCTPQHHCCILTRHHLHYGIGQAIIFCPVVSFLYLFSFLA